MSQGAGAPARRRWPWIVGALVVAALVFADHRGLLLVPRSDDMKTPPPDGPVTALARG